MAKPNSDLRRAAIIAWRKMRVESHELHRVIKSNPSMEPPLRTAFVLGFFSGGALMGQIARTAATVADSLREPEKKEQKPAKTPDVVPVITTVNNPDHT